MSQGLSPVHPNHLYKGDDNERNDETGGDRVIPETPYTDKQGDQDN